MPSVITSAVARITRLLRAFWHRREVAWLFEHWGLASLEELDDELVEALRWANHQIKMGFIYAPRAVLSAAQSGHVYPAGERNGEV